MEDAKEVRSIHLFENSALSTHAVYWQAKNETHGMDIDGQKVRVDFSLTEKPHDRTPGIYMGTS